MQFNLIDERWIPVIRQDGTAMMIAPWEVSTQLDENPVMKLNAPRADFNGALIQFLIGLVQTVAAPKIGIEWKRRLEIPPRPNELKAAFETFHHAFELGGDGPRFMQDFENLNVAPGEIDGLLIDMPGENTKKKNIDHFVKRYTVRGMCPSCCATALFTMQTNAPSGGAGYRTSLRGGGPLSTLIAGDAGHATLWHLIWLNVLGQIEFQNICGNPSLTAPSSRFPWLAPTRTSDSDAGVDSTPEGLHPAMMFWGMPRRIRLHLENLVSGSCDTCGATTDRLIQHYQEKNYGMNFTGAWLHPLSPYSTNKDGELLPAHAQPGGVGYRHWLGLVHQDKTENKMPARVVHKYGDRSQPGWHFRLWAFGYDMDKMKPRCWYESTMPLVTVDATIRDKYEQCVAGMVMAATGISRNVRSGVKSAWFRRPGDKNGDTTFVDNSFWQQSEAAFYEALAGTKSALESGGDGLRVRQRWHSTLCVIASNLFDSYAWEGPIEDADPKRVVIARRKMESFNKGKKIKELLGLPVEQKTAGKSARKKEANLQGH